LMGDWNTSATRLERVLQRWRGRAEVSAAVRTCQGSSLTFRGPRVWRDLDHMVASPAASAMLSRPRVNRTWDTSDHWPLGARIRAEVGAAGDAPGNGNGSGLTRGQPGT